MHFISLVVVVVALLFYVHGKHLRSVNLTTLFLGRLRPPKRLTSTSCTYFRQQLTTALLEKAEGETKLCCQTGYRTQDPWLTSQVPYRLRYAARPFYQPAQHCNFEWCLPLIALTVPMKCEYICSSVAANQFAHFACSIWTFWCNSSSSPCSDRPVNT